MATSSELLLDAFDRIAQTVDGVLDGIGEQALHRRPDATGNPVAWLVWHLTRVQDDHIAEVADRDQVWLADGWQQRFSLPLDADDTGYGHSSEQVAAVRCDPEQLRAYHHAVHARTTDFVRGLTDAELDRIVDDSYDPPVTLAVRLISVIEDDLQHAGQAAYVRGLVERAG